MYTEEESLLTTDSPMSEYAEADVSFKCDCTTSRASTAGEGGSGIEKRRTRRKLGKTKKKETSYIFSSAVMSK